jgi:hypothetical protein
MPDDFSDRGAIQVNGQWVTSINFSITPAEGTPSLIELHFKNADTEVASARLSIDDARTLLGQHNVDAMLKSVPSGDEIRRSIEGTLQRRDLVYREITLPADPTATTDNTIEPGTRSQTQTATDRNEPPAPQRAGDDTARPHKPARDPLAVPRAVTERFLKLEDKYYFHDQTLAFIDLGDKLKARSNNLEVVRSLVAIAQARGWDAVSVRGTEDFRREVWREASRHGIEVHGYDATELERLALQRSAGRRPQGDTQFPADRGHNRSAGAAASAHQTSTTSTERLTGRLVDHGAASYRFDPKANLSYFVKIQTHDGERTFWGIDLERALIESKSGVGIGDMVSVESRGSQRVKIKVPQRDDAGNLIGEQALETRRNAWRIEKPSWFDELAEKAAALRANLVPKPELVQQHPDLTNAVVGLWLGEQFADRMIERPEDRERVVALVRDRLADAVQRGDTIHAPMLKDDIARMLNDEREPLTQPPRRRATPRTPVTPRRLQPDEPSHARE